MDVVYEASIVVVVVLGLVVGALSFTGHRDLALWVTYGAIVIAIGGGFAYWQD